MIRGGALNTVYDMLLSNKLDATFLLMLTFCLVLLLSKTMLLNIVKRSMKGLVKIFFGQSKIHVRYQIS